MISMEDVYESELPIGWVKAFGEDLVREINAADPEVEIVQAKEKYGSLRFYYHPSSDAVDEIISKYEALSEHICFYCGKPDVPRTVAGWIEPICRDCYKKIDCTLPYEEATSSSNRMPDSYTTTRYTLSGKKVVRKYDISADAARIRARWEETYGNGSKRG